MKDIKIAVLGLGYVGLPIALAFAKKYSVTVGYDINIERVNLLKSGVDVTGEGFDAELKSTKLKITADPVDLSICNFYVVTVPTPVDQNHNPDLTPVLSACEIIGKVIRPGSIVVFESTVYPGVTEEICGPTIEKISGLRSGKDFKLAYSPERINPGDQEHSLENVIKVVSGEDAETLETVATVYSSVIKAGIHKAESIKVAEAAKVIENTQRDLNIALMNELAIIFDKIGISTRDVLTAAGTKWNFIKFSPGLVGGHCIGVDPYYLTTKAEQLGYHPQVILAGRRINDGMGSFIAQRFVKLMVHAGIPIKGARIGVLGITFKENVRDIRNSRVPDIIRELAEFGIVPVVTDPVADPEEVKHEYGITLTSWQDLKELDGLIIAVAHNEFSSMPLETLLEGVSSGGVVADIKSILKSRSLPRQMVYWSL